MKKWILIGAGIVVLIYFLLSSLVSSFQGAKVIKGQGLRNSQILEDLDK